MDTHVNLLENLNSRNHGHSSKLTGQLNQQNHGHSSKLTGTLN